MKPVDFEAIRYPDSPNKYMVCPENYSNVTPFATSITYPISAPKLKNLCEQLFLLQPRVKLLSTSEDQLQQQYIQRSLIFRFPDFIDVRFIAVDENQSSIAMYSRSKYGYSDLGVNKKRVKFWLSLIDQALNK